jgi:hypothetical protein
MEDVRIAPYTGTLEELQAAAEPVWNDYYKGRMRIDQWNPTFMRQQIACGAEWMPLAATVGGELAGFVAALGYDALLFDKPLRLAYVSWMTTLPRFRPHVKAAQLYAALADHLKGRGYHAGAALFDAGSRMYGVVANNKLVGEDFSSPFYLAKHTALARVLGPKALRRILIPTSDRWLLRCTGAARSPRAPRGFFVRDLARARAEEAELRLRRDVDLQITLTAPQAASSLASPPYLRTVEILEGERSVGLVQFLDLPMLADEPVGCAVIERFWFAAGKLRPGMAAFFAAMEGEDKCLVLLSLATQRLRERAVLVSLGMLPDLTRPLAIVAVSLDRSCHRDLGRVRTAQLLFR